MRKNRRMTLSELKKLQPLLKNLSQKQQYTEISTNSSDLNQICYLVAKKMHQLQLMHTNRRIWAKTLVMRERKWKRTNPLLRQGGKGGKGGRGRGDRVPRWRNQRWTSPCSGCRRGGGRRRGLGLPCRLDRLRGRKNPNFGREQEMRVEFTLIFLFICSQNYHQKKKGRESERKLLAEFGLPRQMWTKHCFGD